MRKVTNMRWMFYSSNAKNIGEWNVSSVTRMDFMFQYATAFNQNINGWDVRKVTNMNEMFRSASTFNQDIGDWNVRSVTNMQYMFYDASRFNRNLCKWRNSILVNPRTTCMFCATSCAYQMGEYGLTTSSKAVCQLCPTTSPTAAPTSLVSLLGCLCYYTFTYN